MHRSYVALLRGINVGGKNKLPMKDLAAFFADAGCSAVRTYIQSGNVIFRADQETAVRIPNTIATSIAARFGIRVPIVLRSQEIFERVVQNNPFVKSAKDPAFLHVLFLWPDTDTAAVRELQTGAYLPDELALGESEIYLYLPNGVSGSKLPVILDAKLRNHCTMRNWRTVNALHSMLREKM